MMMQPAVFPGAGTPPPLRANTGGPMSRTRTQRVHTTLLGRDDNIIRCPRVIRIGLLFDSRIDPVAQLETLLLMERIESPEDHRGSSLRRPSAVGGKGDGAPSFVGQRIRSFGEEMRGVGHSPNTPP